MSVGRVRCSTDCVIDGADCEAEDDANHLPGGGIAAGLSLRVAALLRCVLRSPAVSLSALECSALDGLAGSCTAGSGESLEGLCGTVLFTALRSPPLLPRSKPVWADRLGDLGSICDAPMGDAACTKVNTGGGSLGGASLCESLISVSPSRLCAELRLPRPLLAKDPCPMLDLCESGGEIGEASLCAAGNSAAVWGLASGSDGKPKRSAAVRQ
jgi:hypothetical protein